MKDLLVWFVPWWWINPVSTLEITEQHKEAKTMYEQGASVVEIIEREVDFMRSGRLITKSR